MQIATHMSSQPERLEGGEARKRHAGTERERDGRKEGKDFVEGERREREIDKSRKQKKTVIFSAMRRRNGKLIQQES